MATVCWLCRSPHCVNWGDLLDLSEARFSWTMGAIIAIVQGCCVDPMR